MNTHFKVFASYNILQYLCDFIHVLIFVTVLKCRKSPKLTNIVINARDIVEQIFQSRNQEPLANNHNDLFMHLLDMSCSGRVLTNGWNGQVSPSGCYGTCNCVFVLRALFFLLTL